MALLRRRNWPLTLLSAFATVLAYALCVFLGHPRFVERHYNAKQRLWAQFLSTCDCPGATCAESFDLTMMHSSLYDRLLLASQGGNRSVVQHLVWQPHKLTATYPWRLRMYAHMGLMLPRSLALLHVWWLAANEELALAMQHLSQGVPLVLDPDAAASLRVAPDAVMECTLDLGDGGSSRGEEAAAGAEEGAEGPEGGAEAGAGAGAGTGSGSGSGSGSVRDARRRRRRRRASSGVGQEGGGDGDAAAATLADDFGSEAGGTGQPGGGAGEVVVDQLPLPLPYQAPSEGAVGQGPDVTHSVNDSDGGGHASRGWDQPAMQTGAVEGGGDRGSGDGGGSGDSGGGNSSGGGGRRGGGVEGPRPGEGDLLRFRCELLEARGAPALLRLLPQPPPPPPSEDSRTGTAGGVAEVSSSSSPPQGAGSYGQEADGGASGVCDAVGGGLGCPAAGDGALGAGPVGGTLVPEGSQVPPEGAGGGGGGGVGAASAVHPEASDTHGAKSTGSAADAAAADGSNRSSGGGGGKGRWRKGRGGGRRSGGRRALGGGASACRNVIFVRPPFKSEVSEHVRDTEASPLGLAPLELLRLALPRVAELVGWVVLPHVMLARYVLLLAPPAPAVTQGDGGGGGGGDVQLPLMLVGTQLMLAAGALLTLFELMLWLRVASELMSLRRPRRSWAARRHAAWRALYEGMVQPLREALLCWNVTHFVVLPLLQLVLWPPALDITLLPMLAYCVVVVGAANSDVAARASPALLRVARRVRQLEGGYPMQLLGIVEAVDPRALPYAARMLLVLDTGRNAGRAAVVAALLEEAPGVAAALAAQQQLLQDAAAAAAGGVGDGGGELAAAMRARVAPAAGVGGGGGGRRRRRGGDAGGGAEEDEYDSDDEDEDEEVEGGAAGRPVVLRWPAPLELPPESHDWEDVPRGFTCAITQQIMSQPAMLVSPDLPSAPTYERAAIQQWLAGQMRDPKSNTPLKAYSLLPNEDLHRAIDDWVSLRLSADRRLMEAAKPSTSGGRDKRGTRRRRVHARPEPVDGAAGPGSRGDGMPYGAADGDNEGAESSYSCDSDKCAGTGSRSGGGGGRRRCHRKGGDGGGGGPTTSMSVLASLAQGASTLLDTGAEVMSRGAAAAAAAATAAVAAVGGTTTAAGGGRRRRRAAGASAAGEAAAATEGGAQALIPSWREDGEEALEGYGAGRRGGG